MCNQTKEARLSIASIERLESITVNDDISARFASAQLDSVESALKSLGQLEDRIQEFVRLEADVLEKIIASGAENVGSGYTRIIKYLKHRTKTQRDRFYSSCISRKQSCREYYSSRNKEYDTSNLASRLDDIKVEVKSYIKSEKPSFTVYAPYTRGTGQEGKLLFQTCFYQIKHDLLQSNKYIVLETKYGDIKAVLKKYRNLSQVEALEFLIDKVESSIDELAGVLQNASPKLRVKVLSRAGEKLSAQSVNVLEEIIGLAESDTYDEQKDDADE